MNHLFLLYTASVFLIIWGIAHLIPTTSVVNPDNKISSLLFILIVVFLIILAIISFFTGFRVKFLPYRLCPFILIAAALLILVGEFL